jgi:SNF2 family DNA or RNA helicase
VHDETRSANETCEHGAIIKPLQVAKRATKLAARKKAVPSEALDQELADWYQAHATEWEPMTDIRAEKQLFKYQQEDVDRFSAATEIGLGHIMGMGKSAIALRIAGEKYLRGEINTLLIVAPNGVHRQWAIEQVPEWLQPEIKRECVCFGGRGGMKFTRPFLEKNALHILCVNIDTFSTPKKWADIAEWVNATRCMIILDEATCIKSVKSKRTERMLYEFNTVKKRNRQTLSSVPNTVARAVLTGTPVTNGPMDLWAIMEFLRPNFFGRNWYSFQNYYAMHSCIDVKTVDDKGNEKHNSIPVLLNEERWHAIKEMASYEMANAVFGVSVDTFNTVHSQDSYQGPYKHAEELRKLIEPVWVFRDYTEADGMPPQNYNRRLVAMDDEISRCYYEMEQELLTEYDDKFATAKNKITAIIRLQQISSGFLSSIIEADTAEHVCNTCDHYYAGECELNCPRVGDNIECAVWAPNEFQLKEDYKSNEITWIGKTNPKLEALYRDVAESARPLIIVTHFTAEAERIYEDLKNEYRCCLMTGWKKIGTMEEFKEGKYDVCVANIRVISRGFNMQNSCTMLFYSNTFSLEDRLQVEGRIWRIGQKNPCMYVDYIYEDTVDMKIVAALRQKRSLLDYIRGVSTKSFLTEKDEVFDIEYQGVYE